MPPPHIGKGKDKIPFTIPTTKPVHTQEHSVPSIMTTASTASTALT